MNPKVLVVDDSLMVRQQVKRALVTAGFDVLEAHDGMDALEKSDQTPGLSLVICDVNMPRMNGLDFLEAFRKDPRFKLVPVVMLTTEAQPELVARAKALEAKGWIIKPFKPDLLMSAAKKLALPAVAA
jgi:two-component system chemotaxis response regulator CheY